MDEPEPPLPGTSVREDLVITFEAIRGRGLAKRTSAPLPDGLAETIADVVLVGLRPRP